MSDLSQWAINGAWAHHPSGFTFVFRGEGFDPLVPEAFGTWVGPEGTTTSGHPDSFRDEARRATDFKFLRYDAVDLLKPPAEPEPEADLQRQLAERDRVIAQYTADIMVMNDILNDCAADADLCQSYEAALDRVNGAVSSFQLVGRNKSYRVSFYVNVPRGFNISTLERVVDQALSEESLDACSSFSWDEVDVS
jgi:hypothetical protein